MKIKIKQWSMSDSELERLRDQLPDIDIVSLSELPMQWADTLLLINAEHSATFVHWAQERNRLYGPPPCPILLYLPANFDSRTQLHVDTNFYCNDYVRDHDWERLEMLAGSPEIIEAAAAAEDIPISFLARLKVDISDVPIDRIPFYSPERNRKNSSTRRMLEHSPEGYDAFVEAVEANRLFIDSVRAPIIQFSLDLPGMAEQVGRLVDLIRSTTDYEIEMFRARLVAPFVSALLSPHQIQPVGAILGGFQGTTRGMSSPVIGIDFGTSGASYAFHNANQSANQPDADASGLSQATRIVETLAVSDIVPLRLEVSGYRLEVLLEEDQDEQDQDEQDQNEQDQNEQDSQINVQEGFAGHVVFRNLRNITGTPAISEFRVEIWDALQPLLVQESVTNPVTGERRVAIPFSQWKSAMEQAKQVLIHSNISDVENAETLEEENA